MFHDKNRACEQWNWNTDIYVSWWPENVFLISWKDFFFLTENRSCFSFPRHKNFFLALREKFLWQEKKILAARKNVLPLRQEIIFLASDIISVGEAVPGERKFPTLTVQWFFFFFPDCFVSHGRFRRLFLWQRDADRRRPSPGPRSTDTPGRRRPRWVLLPGGSPRAPDVLPARRRGSGWPLLRGRDSHHCRGLSYAIGRAGFGTKIRWESAGAITRKQVSFFYARYPFYLCACS